jgi:bifunctional UDP-N-acetylglucosamine pyrophosphorylase/glucosamine-1-phosphate N-acetyltransferase
MAAGIGTRMKSATPKHLHPLLGRRMVDWVVEAARAGGVERIVVVASPQTSGLLDGVEVAVQEKPLGTGDAVRSARAALEDFRGNVLVLNGDVPALRAETIRALVETHCRAGAAATVLSFEPADPGAYGRIVRDGDGRLARIVEAADASAEETAVREVNSGIYVFRAEKLWPALQRTRSGCSSPTASTAPSFWPKIRSRPRASTRAPSWRWPQPRSATGSTRGTCSPA